MTLKKSKEALQDIPDTQQKSHQGFFHFILKEKVQALTWPSTVCPLTFIA